MSDRNTVMTETEPVTVTRDYGENTDTSGLRAGQRVVVTRFSTLGIPRPYRCMGVVLEVKKRVKVLYYDDSETEPWQTKWLTGRYITDWATWTGYIDCVPSEGDKTIEEALKELEVA